MAVLLFSKSQFGVIEMPVPDSFYTFLGMVWRNRETVMAARTAAERTGRIYHYYYYYEGMVEPEWRASATELRQAMEFLQRKQFIFQPRWNEGVRGAAIAEAANQLVEILEQDSSHLALLLDIKRRVRGLGTFDRDARMAVHRPQTVAELLQHDPAFPLDKFLFHYGPKAANGARYRIYLTPTSQRSMEVYKDFINEIEAGFHFQYDFPNMVKVMIPGPKYFKRADRIVIYCLTEAEMKGGLEFLRDYQMEKRMWFEAASPRSTKTVEGLRGVAITPQPTPDPGLMAQAGQTRIAGMSFGMSRAAIIYLALRDTYKVNPPGRGGDDVVKFFNLAEQYARRAGLDLSLDSLPQV